MDSKLKKKVAAVGIATILACYSNTGIAQKPIPKITPKQNISTNALIKLSTLQQQQLKNIDLTRAAKNIQAQEGYSDFFVEGSGDPWHEAFGDAMKGSKILTANTLNLSKDATLRAQSLKKLNVMTAYNKMKAGK